jgi:dipeptidyl aminopeptidase/acylaminoacyl peptidase
VFLALTSRSRFAALLCVFAAASSTAEPPPRYPVRDFFANPAVASPRLSDDGQTIAAIRNRGDVQVVFSMAGDGSITPLAKLDDPDNLMNWIEWANSDRLLISAHARLRLVSRGGLRLRMTRLYGVDRDGQNFVWLGERWPGVGPENVRVPYEDQVIAWTPADRDGVLLQYWVPGEDSPKVVRVNVNTGKTEVTQARSQDITDWRADAAGNVRAGEATTKAAVYQLWARASSDPNAILEKVIERPAVEGQPTFAGFHADPTKLYVYDSHEGRRAIFEFDIATKQRGALVFAHPEVDVDGLAYEASASGRVVGARYTVDRPAIHYFDAAAEAEFRALGRAFENQLGGAVSHQVVSVSANGAQQILEVSSETQPPVYYFFDREKRELNRVLETRAALKREHLAPTRRASYPARDGLAIPSYLTLPLESTGKQLPVVVLVHGGPWARDTIGWDPEVQVLANRGFAVFQMNFRGSEGFGEKHLVAGYREWGQKIQDDITDGVKWLIAEGVADPDRVGIMGGSFGGYATLIGLVKTPELFRAGAAYAPVTDIELLLRDDKTVDWEYDWHETLVGGESGDKSRLRESSPLRRVAEIRAPVLLGHGADDQRVHVRQSQRMAEALKRAGKLFEYLEFPDEIHGFALESNRIRWYEALVAFFETNLAKREKQEPAR